jgi:5-methyltetrahydropteroyltriglutamate--homocysteine methyltransferase
MHLYSGNFRSTWMARGGYEPLRLLPKNKHAVLGIMTSKTGALESKDRLERRLDEAAKFASLDQLRLGPQCGFASTEEGNLLAEEEQWAKLARCVEVVEEVWG